MKNVSIERCEDMYDYQIAMYLSIVFPAQLCTSFGVSVFVQQIIKTAEY